MSFHPEIATGGLCGEREVGGSQRGLTSVSPGGFGDESVCIWPEERILPIVMIPYSASELYLEIGSRKVLAGAIHWPGWCRFGRDEESAVQALLDAAPRYRRIMVRADLGFSAPQDKSDLQILERLEGNATNISNLI